MLNITGSARDDQLGLGEHTVRLDKLTESQTGSARFEGFFVGSQGRALPAPTRPRRIEFIGEDLEGFWEADEAEGGARLLVGPSLRIAPTTRRWQIGVAGGPIIHATRSNRASDAARGLPSGSSGHGYAVRASLSYAF